MYLCVDLKCFYASCECCLRKLDPFSTPLVVADIERGLYSVVLAVSPFLRRKGLSSRSRIIDIPEKDRKDIIFAKPRIAKYIDYSHLVYQIICSMFDKEDVYVYSIDESFIDVASYLKLYKKSAEDIALELIGRIKDELSLPAACGIGDNLFLSKIALDLFSKHEQSQVFFLTKEHFYEKVWYHRPLSDIWSIGANIEKRLHSHNIFDLKGVVDAGQKLLHDEFGIIGDELYEHALGVEKVTIRDIKSYRPIKKSISCGQVLFEEYTKESAIAVVLEMADVITLQLVDNQCLAKTFGIAIGYLNKSTKSKGFARTYTLDVATCQYSVISQIFRLLYEENSDDEPIKRINLSASGLHPFEYGQMTLWDYPNKEKEIKLYKSLSEIKRKYGKDAVNKLSSEQEFATQRKRNKLIGGHNSE